MPKMNKTQEYLLRAGTELGIRVIFPFELSLGSGKKLLADALLPELGSPKGMIVSQSFAEFRDYEDELIKLGYGLSTYYEPSSHEEFDVESYKEMFIEWGWNGDKAKKPDWLVEHIE